MWTKFRAWLHHLLDPHCEECFHYEVEAEEKSKHCKTCDVYRSELDRAHRVINELVEKITYTPGSIQEAPAQVNFQELGPRKMAFRERRRLLEESKRKEAEILREFRKNNEVSSVGAIQPITEDDLDAELKSVEN
jgi:hypothetical protein